MGTSYVGLPRDGGLAPNKYTHLGEFPQAMQVVRGQVLHGHQGAQYYVVNTDFGQFNCVSIGHGRGDLGAQESGGYLPGELVYVAVSPSSPALNGVILARADLAKAGAYTRVCPTLVHPQVAGFEPGERFSGRAYEQFPRLKSFNQGLKDVLDGEWVMHNMFGGAVGVEMFRVFLQGGPMCGVHCYTEDQSMKIIAARLDILTPVGSEEIGPNKAGELESVDKEYMYSKDQIVGWLPQILELRGAPFNGLNDFLTYPDGTNGSDFVAQLQEERCNDDEDQDNGGNGEGGGNGNGNGDGEGPVDGEEDDEESTEPTGRASLIHEHRGLDGSYVLTAANMISFQKSFEVPFPIDIVEANTFVKECPGKEKDCENCLDLEQCPSSDPDCTLCKDCDDDDEEENDCEDCLPGTECPEDDPDCVLCIECDCEEYCQEECSEDDNDCVQCDDCPEDCCSDCDVTDDPSDPMYCDEEEDDPCESCRDLEQCPPDDPDCILCGDNDCDCDTYCYEECPEENPDCLKCDSETCLGNDEICAGCLDLEECPGDDPDCILCEENNCDCKTHCHEECPPENPDCLLCDSCEEEERDITFQTYKANHPLAFAMNARGLTDRVVATALQQIMGDRFTAGSVPNAIFGGKSTEELLFNPDPGMWKNMPQSFELALTPDGKSKRFYWGKALISITEDGSVVFQDAQGAQLMLAGGNIYMSAPHDISAVASRNMLHVAGSSMGLRAQHHFDAYAQEGRMTMMSANQFTIVGGVGGHGGVLLESQGDYSADNSTGELPATSGSVIIRAVGQVGVECGQLNMEARDGHIFAKSSGAIHLNPTSNHYHFGNGFLIENQGCQARIGGGSTIFRQPVLIRRLWFNRRRFVDGMFMAQYGIESQLERMRNIVDNIGSYATLPTTMGRGGFRAKWLSSPQYNIASRQFFQIPEPEWQIRARAALDEDSSLLQSSLTDIMVDGTAPFPGQAAWGGYAMAVGPDYTAADWGEMRQVTMNVQSAAASGGLLKGI